MGMTGMMERHGGVAVGCGPRAVEEGLLSEVGAALDAGEREPALLAQPLRIVVPSRSLREHLCAALVRRAGRGRVGLLVQTLDAVAHEVLQRAGKERAPSLLYPLLVCEAARREPDLARELGDLEDGYAAVVASVDDLLDAGFTPGHAGALSERLGEIAGGVARASAVLRVAAGVAAEISSGTLGHRSAQFAEAAATLEGDPRSLPARGMWIHGFADVTGVQADLLEALVRACDARVWLDLPGERYAAPEAAADGGDGRFGAAMRERFLGRAARSGPGAAAEVHRGATRHADPEAEARAAAGWARARIDEGAEPERLAIVARDLERYRLPLRRQLRRLAVPFSGHAEPGAAGASARRLGALGELLQRREAVASERWLEALERVPARDGRGSWRVPRGEERADWAYAFHTLGAATLIDVARLDRERIGQGVQLATRRGFVRADGDGRPTASRRRVDLEDLARVVAAARVTLRLLRSAPERGPLSAHRAALGALVTRGLGWELADAGEGARDLARAGAGAALVGALSALEIGPSAAGESDRLVAREDWAPLLRRRLGDAGRDALGGHGGGVRVLSVMEARGRCFEGLWVLGLNRGLFPRRFSEDPLLPDALRRPLRDILPDLPLKGAALEEERFLFDQLARAAPRVQLSCARLDERGRPLSPSPFFDRSGDLRLEEAPAEAAGSLHDATLRGALEGSRDDFARVLPLALEAGRRALGLPEGSVAPLVEARLGVLREVDAPRVDLGPYLGMVGEARHPADPRRAPAYVTLLEGTARCPWQVFLRRLLGLAPPVDALEALPAASEARLLGSAVHAALERLGDPVSTASRWPAEPASEEVLVDAARRALLDEGVSMRGYARALARRAAPYVEEARRLLAADPAEVIDVEREDEIEMLDAAGNPRPLRFKSDLVERIAAEGGAPRLRLTDYKTGALKIVQRGKDTRREAYRRQVAQGTLLQAHAYARVAEGAIGRYAFLKPGIDDALRLLVAESDEGPQRRAFDSSVASLFEALDRGALPPRLRGVERDEEPDACRDCEVKLACLRGDSGARRRLGAWAEAARAGNAVERAALALWRIAGASA